VAAGRVAVIAVHALSGPQLALLREAQERVLAFLARQVDWSEADRQLVSAVFAEVVQW
jgi:hypothetical protein